MKGLNTDIILLFVAGMIVGGFIYIRVERMLFAKYYADTEGEERAQALKKLGFQLTFTGVFLLVVVYFLIKSAVLAGICAGFAIFGIKP